MATGRIMVENHAQKPYYNIKGKQKRNGWTEMKTCMEQRKQI